MKRESASKSELQAVEWWTAQEVARYVRVSESTVNRWFESGKLIGTKIGKKWRATTEAVYALVESGLPKPKESEPQAPDLSAFTSAPEYRD